MYSAASSKITPAGTLQNRRARSGGSSSSSELSKSMSRPKSVSGSSILGSNVRLDSSFIAGLSNPFRNVLSLPNCSGWKDLRRSAVS